MQAQEIDAFLLGMLHLLQTCRHLCLRTTVNQRDISTQTLGCSAGIHCGISTTYNQHFLADIHRGVCLGVSCIHQIDSGEIFVTRHDVDGILSRYAHKIRQASTRSHVYPLESFLFQFLNSDGFSNNTVSRKLHAHTLQVVYFHIHNLIGQPEFRYAVFQHTTDFVQRFKHMNIITFFSHISSKAQPRRT